jgi:(p)ppGpp synthase/HD superfamily hydrolase
VPHDNRSTTQRVDRRERSRVASIDRPDREVHEDHESCRSAHKKEFSLLTDRFDEAFQYAHRLHRTQTRKGTTIPYISHLMVVAALVIEHGGTEDQAIAALLHDAVEDQGGVERLSEIRKKFGDNIATIVSDCTDAWTEPKPEWRPRKEAYLAVLPGKPRESLLVSLADKTHNAEAILFDYRALADRIWERFNGGAEGTRWYYSALAEVFSKAMPGPLADRLSRSVSGFSL